MRMENVFSGVFFVMGPAGHHAILALVRMDRTRIPGGTRQNDGLETGLWGAYGRDISVEP